MRQSFDARIDPDRPGRRVRAEPTRHDPRRTWRIGGRPFVRLASWVSRIADPHHDVAVPSSDFCDTFTEACLGPVIIDVREPMVALQASIFNDERFVDVELHVDVWAVAPPRSGHVVESLRFTAEPMESRNGEEAERSRSSLFMREMPTPPVGYKNNIVNFFGNE